MCCGCQNLIVGILRVISCGVFFVHSPSFTFICVAIQMVCPLYQTLPFSQSDTLAYLWTHNMLQVAAESFCVLSELTIPLREHALTLSHMRIWAFPCGMQTAYTQEMGDVSPLHDRGVVYGLDSALKCALQRAQSTRT